MLSDAGHLNQILLTGLLQLLEGRELLQQRTDLGRPEPWNVGKLGLDGLFLRLDGPGVLCRCPGLGPGLRASGSFPLGLWPGGWTVSLRLGFRLGLLSGLSFRLTLPKPVEFFLALHVLGERPIAHRLGLDGVHLQATAIGGGAAKILQGHFV